MKTYHSMLKPIWRFFYRIFSQKKTPTWKKSYSQCGEDIIMESILSFLDIEEITYLDIGAHDPELLSNTAFFYKKGAHGTNVEPDPSLISKFDKQRRRDINICAGIGIDNQSKMDFYIINAKTLNTLSKTDAEKFCESGKYWIEKVINIPLLNINEVIEDNFVTCPDLISIDVEGLELKILKQFDYSKFEPSIFCVETLSFNDLSKDNECIDFLCSNGYFVHSDTMINTIFVNKNKWDNALINRNKHF